MEAKIRLVRPSVRALCCLLLASLIAGCGPSDDSRADRDAKVDDASRLGASESGGTGRAVRVDEVAIPASTLQDAVLPNPRELPALVFLPPNYADSPERSYPVVYYLPGFTTDVTEYIDGTFDGFHFGRTLSGLIGDGSIGDIVVVVVHGRNDLGGSFFVNSPVTGRWEDFVVEDVIRFIESNYRVSRKATGRGIAGESMGGTGAIHLAMRHPNVFGSVFSISPGLFGDQGLEDLGILSAPYVRAREIQSGRMKDWPADEGVSRFLDFIAELYAAGGFNYRRAFYYAYGAAFAPDPNSGPPFSRLEVARRSDRLDPEGADGRRSLEAGFGDLGNKVRTYDSELRSLSAIGLDVGSNDPLDWIPRGTRRFATLLEEAEISVQLTEHDGGHVDRLGERIEDEMLPFFSRVFYPSPDGGSQQ